MLEKTNRLKREEHVSTSNGAEWLGVKGETKVKTATTFNSKVSELRVLLGKHGSNTCFQGDSGNKNDTPG